MRPLAYPALLLALVFASEPLQCRLANPRIRTPHLEPVSPTQGWSVSNERLLRTDNGGGDWRDITPKRLDHDTSLAAAFFKDTQDGWAVFSAVEGEVPKFELASTSDGGAIWTTHDIVIPDPHLKNEVFSGTGNLSFLDDLQGWLNLALDTGMHGAMLLSTKDGGLSWSIKDGPGATGTVYFKTDKIGWILGSWDGVLYATRDGAETWQEVKVPTPQLPFTTLNAIFVSLPKFSDAQHASIEVTYSSAYAIQLVTFASDDGGVTWKPVSQKPLEVPPEGLRLRPRTLSDCQPNEGRRE